MLQCFADLVKGLEQGYLAGELLVSNIKCRGAMMAITIKDTK